MMKSLITTAILFLATPINAQEPSAQSVITTMCEVCTDGPAASVSVEAGVDGEGCKTYTTPLNQCYNAQSLFPDDPSWSVFDIYDEMSMKSMKRTFYKSENGSCSNVAKLRDVLEVVEREFYFNNFAEQDDDYFILPFDECVGPFGPPRPWGKFTLVQNDVMPQLIGGDSVAAKK
jgi:hypothetical protein